MLQKFVQFYTGSKWRPAAITAFLFALTVAWHSFTTYLTYPVMFLALLFLTSFVGQTMVAIRRMTQASESPRTGAATIFSGFILIGIFALCTLFASCNGSLVSKSHMMKETIKWAGIAPLPKSTSGLKMQFTIKPKLGDIEEYIWVRFHAKPAVISMWLADCPGRKHAKEPTMIRNGAIQRIEREYNDNNEWTEEFVEKPWREMELIKYPQRQRPAFWSEVENIENGRLMETNGHCGGQTLIIDDDRHIVYLRVLLGNCAG